jgi:hypothetical protein
MVLLAGAQKMAELRKGYAHLVVALRRVMSDRSLQTALAGRPVVCAVFGDTESIELVIPLVNLGRLAGDAELALAYRAADLFVLPTLEDNLPNTLLESVAAGTPVVAYAVGGIPDLVTEGTCGVVVPRGDVDGLARGISALLVDDEARLGMREACHAWARRRLDLPVQARAYLALYEQALADRRATRATTGGPVRLQPSSAHADAVAAGEAELMAAALAEPRLTSRLLMEVAGQVAGHQALIAARGGEIVALTAALDAVRRELQDSLRRIEAVTAERAALRRRLSQVMKRVVIFGSGEEGRRAWEALVRSGGAEIAGFVDADERQHGRSFLGSLVHSPEWLDGAMWDVVVIALADAGEARRYLDAAGVSARRVIVFPGGADEAALTEEAERHFADPLAALLAGGRAPSRSALQVGIFGTGAGAMRVWEALSEIDGVEVAWFADNNPARQGQALLWLDVIAPSLIPARPVDAVVVGSMSREPIRQQLLALGVPHEQILTPDVVSSAERVAEQLEAMLLGLGRAVPQ